MTVQCSVAVRNAANDARETAAGTAVKFQVRTGAQPADCAAADSGTLLAELSLPSDWLGNSAAGVKALAGTWAGTGAAAGTAAHFRIKDTAGTTCHFQGSITATGGGGDATMDNTSVAVGQAVSVNTFNMTEGNP